MPISNGTSNVSYASVTANGQSFTVPVADCPAGGCANGSPIAWDSTSPGDKEVLAAYQSALDKEGSKSFAKLGIGGAVAVLAPPTLVGTVGGGAIIGGGSSAAEQLIDTGHIDAGKTAVDTVVGAGVGAATYGVIKGAGAADALLDGMLPASTKVGGEGIKGAVVEPVVIAKGTVNGAVFEDVNQSAKLGATNVPTLIAERVAAKIEAQGKPFPNGTIADSHAEIGVIQQVYNAGKTQVSDMSMIISGKDICGYCKGDIAAAADAAGLKSLTVQAVDNITGLPKVYCWQVGVKSIKEKP